MKRKAENELPNNPKCVKLEIDDLTCPITKAIFKFPVIADDGFNYERWAIDKVIGSDNPVSPITRTLIKGYHENKNLANKIKEFLAENPDLQVQQFSLECYYNFMDNINLVEMIINNKNFRELATFTNILLTKSVFKKAFAQFICEAPLDITSFSKIIDNSVDINCLDDFSRKPIYYAIMKGSDAMVFCMLEHKAETTNINNDQTLMKLAIECKRWTVVKYELDHKLEDLELNFADICQNNKNLGESILNQYMELGKFSDDEYFNLFVLLNPENLEQIVLNFSFEKIMNFFEKIMVWDISEYFKKYIRGFEKTDELNTMLIRIIDNVDENSLLIAAEKKEVADMLDELFFKKLKVEENYIKNIIRRLGNVINGVKMEIQKYII